MLISYEVAIFNLTDSNVCACIHMFICESVNVSVCVVSMYLCLCVCTHANVVMGACTCVCWLSVIVCIHACVSYLLSTVLLLTIIIK